MFGRKLKKAIEDIKDLKHSRDFMYRAHCEQGDIFREELLRIEFPKGHKKIDAYKDTAETERTQAKEEGYVFRRVVEYSKELWVKE